MEEYARLLVTEPSRYADISLLLYSLYYYYLILFTFLCIFLEPFKYFNVLIMKNVPVAVQ